MIELERKKVFLREGLGHLTQAVLGLGWTDGELGESLVDVFALKGVLDPKTMADAVWGRLKRASFAGSDLALREALLLLTNDDSASRHDSRGRLDRPFSRPSNGPLRDLQSAIGEKWQARRLLDFFVDLREALSVPPPECRPGEILILDDHPGTDFDAIYRAVSEFLLGDPRAIRLVNPLVSGSGEYDDTAFYFFAEYQTLHVSRAPVKVSEFVDRLKISSEGTRFVLVDQLFKLKRRGRDEFLGAQVIRGLIRWMHDNREDLVGRGGLLPEVLALSRTDEPKIIQAALRAGAKDYVLKSRFVSLPAVLARVGRGVSDPANSLHRNFRVLYDLPSETMRLLQSARIPRIAFHQRNKREKVKPLQEWSALLARLPKADLHVHAGSVMAREFLTLASIVMLARHPLERDTLGRRDGTSAVGRERASSFYDELCGLVAFYNRVVEKGVLALVIAPREEGFGGTEGRDELDLAAALPSGSYVSGADWIQGWGQAARTALGARLRAAKVQEKRYGAFRAHLHRDLGIRDYLSGERAEEKLRSKNDLELVLYLLRHAKQLSWNGSPVTLSVGGWKSEDLIRVYLLVLASKYKNGGTSAAVNVNLTSETSVDLLQLFRSEDGGAIDQLERGWHALHGAFYAEPEAKELAGVGTLAFRARGWSWDRTWCEGAKEPLVCVVLPWDPRAPEDPSPLEFSEDPIGYTLATGTRSGNLAEYLLGCEFSGAEHLRHPFLIHVYARQVLFDWVGQGVFYAELKTSPDGFINPEIGFEHSSVVQCLVQAFSEAQQEVLEVYREACAGGAPEAETVDLDRARWPGCVLGTRYNYRHLRRVVARGADKATKGSLGDIDFGAWSAAGEPSREGLPTPPARLPCKTSLVFVGKRHKSLREMILEAAGAAVMRPAGETPTRSAREFVAKEFVSCRVVGFDLAGQEDGYPPSDYADEFGRLSRLHVPITVHAGENAPPQFIEDAILELGAVRIGHGLSLAEDRRLLARVRDERIAIELCPVCNHQTSQFHEPRDSATEGADTGRPYPLADFLRSGLYVTINTDNPIISDTNMVREFYQASWAYDAKGLSLWEALRIIRMGFVCCFLNLQERRHLLELVGQYLFDVFSDDAVIETLRRLDSNQT